MRAFSTALCAVSFCLCMCLSGFAQTITGSFRGTVTDPSGAVVQGAKVTATNVATGVTSQTITNNAGTYTLRFLQIGNYNLSFEAPNFMKENHGPIAVEIDREVKVDAQLKLGAATDVITVGEEVAPILETESSTIGTTLSANMIENIPINGQNFASLTVYMPGAVTTTPGNFGGQNGSERATDASSVPAVNGNRQQSNNFILDGIEINETMNNTVGYNPNPEALAEVKIITSNAAAEYGNFNGGAVVAVMKSGTNQYHGEAFGFLENYHLDANTWANKFAGNPRNQYTQSIFGATFGAPILKNKLFYFVDYEGMRHHTGGLASTSVAPAAWRDPSYAQSFGMTLTNPAAIYLFAHPELYPLPNHAPTAGYAAQNNYQGWYKQFMKNDQGDAKIDWKINDKDSVMGRVSVGKALDSFTHAVIPIDFPSSNEYPFAGVALNWVHVFSPNVVNLARAGFSRAVYTEGTTVDQSGELGTNGNSLLGIPGTQQLPGFSYMGFNSGEVASFGSLGWMIAMADNTFHYSDQVTWQRGHHVLKFGADFTRYQQNFKFPGDLGALGEFAYDGTVSTAANANVPAAAAAFLDFETNQSVYKGVGAVTGYAGQRQWRDGIFAQDDWKVRPNLTINLGLRWEYNQPIYEVNNKELNIDTKTMTLVNAGKNGNSRALYNSTLTNFLPRIGFSYQPVERWVVRGGYGITTYLEGTGANLRLTQNSPYAFSYEQSATAGNYFKVEDGLTSASAPASSTYYAWDKNLKPAFIQNYNFTLEYELTNQTSIRAGYVGEKGIHLIDARYGNTWTRFNDPTSAPYAKLVTPNGLLGSSGVVKITESKSKMNYNALQVVLRQRASHGLEYTVNYTYGKALTDNPGFYGTLGINGPSPYWQDAYNPMGDYGPAGYDVRHNLTANAVYELPFGKGKQIGSSWNSTLNQVLGGWKVGTTMLFYSGFPVTISSWNAVYDQINGWPWNARSNHYRPLHITGRSTAHWFGTDASATPCIGADNGSCAYGSELSTGFGTSSQGSERAPAYRQVDFSLFKSFRITDSQRFEFRTDLFNAFNIASYNNPDSTVQDSTFGQITSTRSPQRQIQFSMKYLF